MIFHLMKTALPDARIGVGLKDAYQEQHMNYAKPLLVAAALLTSGAAFSADPPEGSYPAAVPAGQVEHGAADLAPASKAGARAWITEGRPNFQAYVGPQASRAEVVSERRDWQASGLAAMSQAAEPVFATPDYQRRLDQYVRSRHNGSAE